MKAAKASDLRIWLIADSEGQESDLVRPGDLVIANKSDLGRIGNVSRETLRISAKSGDGVDLLEAKIIERLSGLTQNIGAPMITRARHRQGIERALGYLQQAKMHLESGVGAEFVAEDVRLGTRELGMLTGHIDPDTVLGAVFSSFCIGK